MNHTQLRKALERYQGKLEDQLNDVEMCLEAQFPLYSTEYRDVLRSAVHGIKGALIQANEDLIPILIVVAEYRFKHAMDLAAIPMDRESDLARDISQRLWGILRDSAHEEEPK